MGCCHDKFPAAATMAGNALQAAGRVVGAALTGHTLLVDPMTFATRRAICLACEHCLPLPRTPEIHRCMKCGCWLDGKALSKLSLATEKCPIGKWEAQP